MGVKLLHSPGVGRNTMLFFNYLWFMKYMATKMLQLGAESGGFPVK